jgi:hypothetical protein
VFFNFGTPGAIAGEKTYFCDDIVFGFQVSAGSDLKEVMKLSLTEEGLRIFSNTMTEVDQVNIFDITGKNIYFSNEKLRVNTLIPLVLHSGSFYLVKIKANNQFVTFKRILMN